MKLQKAIYIIIFGVIALIAYGMIDEKENQWSKYILHASGVFLMLGGLLFLCPILLSKKDNDGCVELDPEAPLTKETNHSQE